MPIVIARTAWVDDSGAGTDGTVINNNAKTSLYEQIDAALAFLSTVGNAIGTTSTGSTGSVLHGPSTALSFAPVAESAISLSDVTTFNVSTGRHGFAPKASTSTGHFLRGGPTPAFEAIVEGDLLLSDITTNNATTGRHGFLPKLSGSASEVLTGAGTFAAAAAAGKAFFNFRPTMNTPPAAAFAPPDVVNVTPVLVFDPSTDTNAVFDGIISTAYAGGPLTASIRWAPTTTSTGDCRWDLAFERRADGVDNIGVDSFAAARTVASPALGTSGLISYASIAFTSAQIDSLAAGESFRLKLTRNASTAADTLTGNARFFGMSLRED